MPDKEYIDYIIARSVYWMLEDGSIFGEIPEFTGVWANEVTMERCQQVLRKVLQEWLYLKLQYKEEIPLYAESRMFSNDHKDESNITERSYKETSGTGI